MMQFSFHSTHKAFPWYFSHTPQICGFEIPFNRIIQEQTSFIILWDLPESSSVKSMFIFFFQGYLRFKYRYFQSISLTETVFFFLLLFQDTCSPPNKFRHPSSFLISWTQKCLLKKISLKDCGCRLASQHEVCCIGHFVIVKSTL